MLFQIIIGIIIYIVGCVVAYGRITSHFYYNGINLQTLPKMFAIASWLSFIIFIVPISRNERYFKWRFDENIHYYEYKKSREQEYMRLNNMFRNYKCFTIKASRIAQTRCNNQEIVNIYFNYINHEICATVELENETISISQSDLLNPNL